MEIIIYNKGLAVKWKDLRVSGGYNNDVEFIDHLLETEEKFQKSLLLYDIKEEEVFCEIPVCVTIKEENSELRTVVLNSTTTSTDFAESADISDDNHSGKRLTRSSRKDSKKNRRSKEKRVINKFTEADSNDKIPAKKKTLEERRFTEAKGEKLKRFKSPIHKKFSRKKGAVPCSRCNRSFSCNDSLQSHIPNCTSKSASDEAVSNICDICFISFKNPKKLEKHKKLHSKNRPFTCDLCNERFKFELSVEKHKLEHVSATEFRCRLCDQFCPSHDEFKAHKQSHITRDRPFKCDKCRKSFKTKNYLENHVMIVHSNEPRGYQCDVCFKVFSVPSKLFDHKRVHSEDRPFKCEQCGVGFKSPYNLQKHTERHKGTAKHRCHECGKVFMRVDGLKLHKVIHSNDRPFVCEQCGKGFRHANTLKRHVVIHGGVPKQHPCDVCLKMFHSLAEVKLHKAVHSDARPFVCESCGQGFKTRSNLRKHKPIHTGERNFVCQTCGKTFNNSGALANHVKGHRRSDVLAPNTIPHRQKSEENLSMCLAVADTPRPAKEQVSHAMALTVESRELPSDVVYRRMVAEIVIQSHSNSNTPDVHKESSVSTDNLNFRKVELGEIDDLASVSGSPSCGKDILEAALTGTSPLHYRKELAGNSSALNTAVNYQRFF